MPPTRPLKVFLCHASADRPAVRKIYRYLRSKGMDPWLDVEKLLPGESWEVEIPKAIFDSDVILVCLSKNSVDKEGYVQKEITFALDKAKEKLDVSIFIIPAKLEECNIPDRLSRYQWVDLYRDDGRRRLMLSLNKRAAQIGPAVEQAIVADDTLERAKMELEAKEKLARDDAEREAFAKAAREKAEREKAEKIARGPVGRVSTSYSKSDPTEPSNEKVSRPESPTYEYTEPKKLAGKIFPVALGSFGLLLIAGIFVVVAIIIANNLPISAQPIPTPALGIGSTMTGEDGVTLVYVPEGEFLMGSKDADLPSYNDEKPQHSVTLDAFWIDQIEVTNAMYAKCVDAGKCDLPSSTDHFSNTGYANHPVVYVPWNDASAYCSWAGRRLPTEAQWEKAARGTDANIYPWGNDEPNKNLLNYNSNVDDTTKTGSYETGKSFYGAYDMAGNVWEWVNDWYLEIYYQSLLSSNPLGPPSSGQYRVLRGGWWGVNNDLVRSANRHRGDPTVASSSIGFRCSRSP